MDQIPINDAQVEPNPPLGLAGPAVWQHEVSRIVYDPWATPDERWAILWHRYLLVDDGNPITDDRHFELGWIGLRTSASAAGLAGAAERKLFSAAAYEGNPSVAAYNDAILGPAEVRLHTLDPRLTDCLAFSEPGATATRNGLYVSLLCGTADPAARRLVLLRRSHPSGAWQYLGVLLHTSQAARIDPTYSGFSASDLVHRGRRVWLLATPTVAPFDFYGGCLLFRLSSPDSAQLRDRDADGLPDVVGGLFSEPGGFAGACGLSFKSRRAGVILSRATFDDPVRYHLIRTGQIP